MKNIIIDYFKLLSLYKNKEFRDANTLAALKHLRVLSFGIYLILPYFLYIDFVFFKNIIFKKGWYVSFIVHVTTVLICTLFQVCFKFLINNIHKSSIANNVVKGLVFISLFFAVITCINAQTLTGNVNYYFIMALFLAFAYPYDPVYMVKINLINYALIIVGLYKHHINDYNKYNNIVIATITLFISIYIVLVLYKMKCEEFINKKRLIKYAYTDSLTGIPNRRKGLELLNNALEKARHNKTSLIICFVDINDLKKVNDSFGHSEGDKLIIIISNVLCKIISDNITVFRYGGDEFIIIIENKTITEAENLCNSIKEQFDILNQEENKPYSIDASFGLYEVDVDKEYTVKEIIEAADRNMYYKKNDKSYDYII